MAWISHKHPPSLSGPDFRARAGVPAELDGERGAGQPLRRQPRLRRLRQVHRRRLQRIRRGEVMQCSVESNHILPYATPFSVALTLRLGDIW